MTSLSEKASGIFAKKEGNQLYNGDNIDILQNYTNKMVNLLT